MKGQSRLEQLRKELGLTQAYLAGLIKVDLRTYANKEKGVSEFKLGEMFIISRELNKSIEDIFLPPNFMLHEEKEEKRCSS